MTGRSGPRRQPRADEQGATLILALAFVVVFSLVTVAVLSFAGTGLKAAGVYVDQGRRSYSADGATQLAIENFSQGNPCALYTAPPINGRQMAVHCDPLNASPATTRTTQPQDALRSLGRAAKDGIDVTTPGLRVQGGVFSHSNVTTGAGASMEVSGDVSAVGDCSPAVSQTRLPPNQAPYAHACANDTPSDPADGAVGADPDYTPPATAVPALRTVPACPGAGSWLVRLRPGYYDDAGALNRLTGGGCHNIVVWLQPGVYAFDFTFTGGTALWTVDDPTVSVVGGTPAGWDPGSAARPAVPDPGGCDRTRPEGVAVMMGGGSRFQVDRGHVELCAPVSPDAQQVAVYGIQPPKPSHTLQPTAIVTNTGFTDPGHALTSGEKPTLPGCSQPTGTAHCTADAVLDPTKRQSASMQLAGFTPQVPPGSVITSATLRVRHEDDGGLTAPGAVKVTTAVGKDTCRTDNLPRHPALATDPPVDLLSACGLTDPARLTGLTVTYAATLDTGAPTATERLDGIWLEVAYRTPTTFKPTVVARSSGFTAAGTRPDNALEIGEQPTPLVAGADLTAAAPSASITLAGFGQPPVPPGSTIDSAVLRVAHQEAGDAAAPRVDVIPAGGGGGCTGLPLTTRTPSGDDRVDLKACGITDAAQLTGLTATYTAGLDDGGTAGADSVDGMWLEVVYDPAPPRTATSAESATFTSPNSAEAIDGADTARAALDAATRPTAAIELGGYVTPAVAPGSVLDSALLHVAHREDPGAAGGAPPTAAVTLTGAGLPRSCTASQQLATHQDALATDTLDLVAACGLTDPAQLVGLAVTYTAGLGADSATATAQLDGITLELAYRPAIAVRPSTATSTATPTAAAFLDPKNAQAIDATASASTLTAATPSATVRLGGFAMLPLPAGSVIDRVVLRVAHQDDATTPAPPSPGQPPTTALTVSGTGTACDADHPLTARQGSLGVDVVDLGACGITRQDQVSQLAVDYAARLGTGSSAATDRLDGVELDIVFRAPSLRALSGCLTAGSDCAVLKSTDTADTATEHSRLVIDGTVYAPTGAVDLSMRQVGSQVVTRGIVARTIALGISPAPGYLRPVIGIPPEPVLFTTYPAVTAKAASVTAITRFTPPAPGAPVDVTDATVPGGGRASLTLGGYAQPAPATTGPLDHAVLQVAHRDDGDVASLKMSVDFTGSTCTGADGALDVPVHPGSGGPVSDQVDLARCGLTRAFQLAGLTVTYTVAAGSGGATEHLDGTRIDLLSGPLVQAAVSFDGHTATVKQWTVLP
ncbi:hypothetical protein [Streptomyces sp. NBC_00083]|uniref:hypothetical protein n=1 Tax=Streptomyces sp. NBC_00083 TaxID=2975647 RepID=UPI0022563456|nr:hypothetical protein [Streptomyces sp. NBC_00083]MCX5384163.1 hypothetical protein [Streptomyces sp. NBC_00083]